MTTRLRRSHLMTHHSRALMLMKDGENMILAERFDDALPLYKLARSHLAESHDERTPELRKVVEKCIAWLEKKLGKESGPAMGTAEAKADAGDPLPVKPALSRTEPDDVELLQSMVSDHIPIEVALSKKAGGE